MQKRIKRVVANTNARGRIKREMHSVHITATIRRESHRERMKK